MSKKENGNPKPRVAISKAVLLDEGLDKKAVRRELAECVGCGDEANTETAEGHMKTTLVTDRELKQSQDGKVLIRCAACKNEHDTRKRNAKKVCYRAGSDGVHWLITTNGGGGSNLPLHS